MNLTEGQLFTIEALNKIQDFVWPKDANFACAFNIISGRHFGVEFYIEKPTHSNAIEAFKGALSKGDPTKVIIGQHPDWRNSLITREQFDSVDGWVRNTNLKLPPELIDSQIEVLHHNGEIAFDDANAFYWDENVDKWRYHKPTKESEIKNIEPSQPPIHEAYYRHKVQRTVTENLRKMLDESIEAEDKLLEQIKAWNLEYGFDIRVLDESDEVPEVEPNPQPELVITDWSDL